MIRSEILVFPRENGERQRVQLVRPDSWDQLRFFRPKPEPERAFRQVTALFRDHIVPKYPLLYGQLVFFRLPDDVPIPSEPDGLDKSARLTLATTILKEGLKVRDRRPYFVTGAAKELFNRLRGAGCVAPVFGKRRFTSILPVADTLGFLSGSAPENGLVANLSFFLMDPLDLATPYDFIGAPIGLRVKDGVIESAPQFHRPMLLVRYDGSVGVYTHFELCARSPLVNYEIGGRSLGYLREHFFLIPQASEGGTTLSIVDGRVVGISRDKRVPVPSSGFTAVSCGVDDDGFSNIKPGDGISMHGMADVRFGIQVGPAAVIKGEPVLGRPRDYYRIKNVPGNLLALSAPYPPALYPCDPVRARAPRMVIGADEAGKPMLLWFEGAAKSGHVPGEDSCGASLRETAEACVELGMKNGVHLDGGGSAQILLNRKRSLLISDRDLATGAEAERAVPTGLMIG